MKYLTLFRHAKANWDLEVNDDIDRPLHKRGETDIPIVAKLLKDEDIVPDKIICSTALRARETAKGLAKALKIPEEAIQYNEHVYNAAASTILGTVKSTHPSVKHLMVIGHNPGLSNLCGHLLGEGGVDLKTADAAYIMIDAENWKECDINTGELEKYVRNPSHEVEKTTSE